MKCSENSLHRFLSLTGVIVDLKYVQDTLNPQMEQLKSKYFCSHPDDPINFHRKEMVNAKHPFEVLGNKDIREKFDIELLEHLEKWEYLVITVCLDKKAHRDTYTTWRYDPYHYCLAILLERFVFFLEDIGKKGDVMAESRGGKEDMRLKRSFANLCNNGTEFMSPQRFRDVFTSKQLKVKSKQNNISGLQLADLIAHPSCNEILFENNLLNRQLAPFGKRIIGILQKKYYQSNNRVFGKKFI